MEEIVYKCGTYAYIAKKDLRSAEKCLACENYDMCGMSCQQAIEKMFKSYIQKKYIGEPLIEWLTTHNLVKLMLKTGIEELSKYRKDIKDISKYYYETRYPGVDFFELDRVDAEEALNTARVVLDIVEREQAVNTTSIECTHEF